ncbi:MAG TPA: YraN family protein [Spirochaetota bacterium]|nr:YraN family protein [Spirochaetota bacterium]HQO41107.1 YraN family protein [Spirochaetota bacterium]
MQDAGIKEYGREGEDTACAFLEEKGFDILERNYRAGKIGELDIIAQRGDLVVIAEVKSRRTAAFGGGIYSITQNKKRTLRRCADHFLVNNPLLYSKQITFRFDLILVENNSVEWVEDIVR